jgi:hypothetical protein
MQTIRVGNGETHDLNMYELIISLFFRGIDFSYKWLDENFLTHIINFTKEFGSVIVMISAVIFLLVAVYLIMKQVRRLPKRYVLEAFDMYGNRTVIPELRVIFTTYQAAASYAQFYNELYREKYQFKLLGIKDNISVVRKKA